MTFPHPYGDQNSPNKTSRPPNFPLPLKSDLPHINFHQLLDFYPLIWHISQHKYVPKTFTAQNSIGRKCVGERLIYWGKSAAGTSSQPTVL